MSDRDIMLRAGGIGLLLHEWPLSSELNNSLIYYIAQAGDTEDTKAFFDQLVRQAPRFQENFMSLAQEWEQMGRREGLQEGVQEGLKKGRQEGIHMVAPHLLGSGIDRGLVKATTLLSDEELDRLA